MTINPCEHGDDCMKLVCHLEESRDWWRDEAELSWTNSERDYVVLSAVAVVAAFLSFWLGVLVG